MIAVIDYGIGNVRSVMNALEFLGAETLLTNDVATLERANGLILPGVGAFGEGMKRLAAHGLCQSLPTIVGGGKPILGICLGFQMLLKSSSEQGIHDGLGFIDCECVRLPVNERLPHIGWNEVTIDDTSPVESRLLKGISGEHFYFVHSYGVVTSSAKAAKGVTQYGGCDIVASLEIDNVFGTQFHPEKSGTMGLKLLSNYLAICA